MSAHRWNLANKTPELAPELRHIVQDEGMSFDDKVRNACLLLENRLRQVAGLEAHDFGTDLIKKIFGEGGIFDSVSPVKAENIGLMNLFLGAVMYYRNPVSHRAMYHDEESTLHVLTLVNHLLFLIKRASSANVRVQDYTGYHEGNITNRRDFRLDIDGDGVSELVILVTAGPIFVDGKPTTRFLPVILKPDGDTGYRRIPCEDAAIGESHYEPYNVMIRNITGQSVPDIITVWPVGETQGGYSIFRRDGNGYVRVERDVTSYPEPYGGPSPSYFLSHGTYKFIQFVDYDGDGQTEIIQRLGFSFDHEWNDLVEKRQQTRARIWKWDAGATMLKCILDVEIAPPVWKSSGS